MDRRHFLAVGAALWLPIDVREADARARKKAPFATEGTFADGVLSGDPSPTAVTFWTRLDANPRDKVRVELEIARDPGFRKTVFRRLIPTRGSRDHTVKVRVGGLKPDRRYYYRFSTRTAHSDVGRTQTAPAPHLAAADQGRLLRLPGLQLGLLRRLPGAAGAGPRHRHLRRRLHLRPRLRHGRLRRGARGQDRRERGLGGARRGRLPGQVPPGPHGRGPARTAPPRPARRPVGRPRGHRQLRRDARHVRRRRQGRARHLRPGAHHRGPPGVARVHARAHVRPGPRPHLPQAHVRAQHRAVHARLALLPRRPALRRRLAAAVRRQRAARVPRRDADGLAQGRAAVLARRTGS